MPRMTADLLVRCTGQAKRKRGETQEQFLKRITHLYCSEKGIEAIEGLSQCRSLSVLYLYDNFIRTINNLASCTALTHLYLQNNNITKIETLTTLHRLSKLYLNGNAITVVEGLETLRQLTELHIAYQRLPEGEKLLFDPRSLSAISGSLCVLNVSGNNLDTIMEIRCLTGLTYFAACDNMLSNMKDLSRTFSHMNQLTKVELSGNPLCQKSKYRDRVITMGSSIVMLDGHEISETERLFLLNWKAMRRARRQHQKKALVEHFLTEPISDPIMLASVAAPPTLPALPARQLPRRSKKRHQQEATYKTFPHLTQDELTGAKNIEDQDSFKLPELVPYQNIITQQEQLMNNLSGHQLQEKPWRTLGVLTEQ